jgi:signal transduction histidine kinase
MKVFGSDTEYFLGDRKDMDIEEAQELASTKDEDQDEDPETSPEEIAAKAALLKEVKETAEAQTKELKATIETLKGEKKDVADKVTAIELQLKNIKDHEQVSVPVLQTSLPVQP